MSGAPAIMELGLHAKAATTPKTRLYPAQQNPVAELAAELGVSETTIYRWRSRTTVTDRSHHAEAGGAHSAKTRPSTSLER